MTDVNNGIKVNPQRCRLTKEKGIQVREKQTASDDGKAKLNTIIK